MGCKMNECEFYETNPNDGRPEVGASQSPAAEYASRYEPEAVCVERSFQGFRSRRREEAENGVTGQAPASLRRRLLSCGGAQ